jgi:8-oxo-dGTP diphosphatase
MFLNRVDVASALLFDEASQKLLIVKNVKGDHVYWSPPGGAVEAGETIEQAVIREVKEESGYDIAVRGLHSVREKVFVGVGHHVIIFTFYAVILGGELNIDDPDHDIVEARWVDLETARELMPGLFEQLHLTSNWSVNTAYYSYEGEV